MTELLTIDLEILLLRAKAARDEWDRIVADCEREKQNRETLLLGQRG